MTDRTRAPVPILPSWDLLPAADPEMKDIRPGRRTLSSSRARATLLQRRTRPIHPLFKLSPCHSLQTCTAESQALGESLLPFCSPIRNADDRKGQDGQLARDGLNSNSSLAAVLQSLDGPKGDDRIGAAPGTSRDASADAQKYHMDEAGGCRPGCQWLRQMPGQVRNVTRAGGEVLPRWPSPERNAKVNCSRLCRPGGKYKASSSSRPVAVHSSPPAILNLLLIPTSSSTSHPLEPESPTAL